MWSGLALRSVERLPLGRWHQWDQSDMHIYLEQGRRLAGGDWLARAPFYPYHLWMSAAPPRKWAAWYGHGVFYQAPLYSYFMAGFLKTGIDPARAARMAHALALAAICILMYLFTRRAFGWRAGLAAGAMTALYGPLLVIASQPLKETLALALTMWILVGLGRWALRPQYKTIFCAGLGVGVLALMHEGTPAIALAILLSIALRARSGCLGPIRRISPIIVFALGAIVGFSPLLARNLAVGAPALAVSTRSPITWALANESSALNGGVTWSPPGEPFVTMMDGAAGRPFGIVSGVIGSYGGRVWVFFGHWAMRALALLSGGEAADNTCYAYFRLYVPTLALSLDFRWLLPLAAAGLVSVRARRWSAELRRGSAAAIVPVFLAIMIVALSAVFPLGRLRLFLLPALIPLAGRGIVALWMAIRARLARAAAVLVAAMIFTVMVQLALDRTWKLGGLRPADFGVAAQIELRGGRPDLAIAELERGAELTGDGGLARQAAAIRGMKTW